MFSGRNQKVVFLLIKLFLFHLTLTGRDNFAAVVPHCKQNILLLHKIIRFQLSNKKFLLFYTNFSNSALNLISQQFCEFSTWQHCQCLPSFPILLIKNPINKIPTLKRSEVSVQLYYVFSCIFVIHIHVAGKSFINLMTSTLNRLPEPVSGVFSTQPTSSYTEKLL